MKKSMLSDMLTRLLQKRNLIPSAVVFEGYGFSIEWNDTDIKPGFTEEIY